MSQNELPAQTLLQQHHARSVSGEELEAFGKRAAARWGEGTYDTLTEAVVETVKHAQFSPEQVRRVVEFANQTAYLAEFKKEGSSHRIVDFAGGPADPSQVIKDLNDGGGGTVFDRGTLDYSMPPVSRMKEAAAEGSEKTASALPNCSQELPCETPYEKAFWEQFGGADQKLAYAEPLRPLADTYNTLKGASDQLASDLDALEVDFKEASQELFHHVKQAALGGYSLGDVLTAWEPVTPDPVFVKAAFQTLTPLLRSSVFPSFDAIGASLAKVASQPRLVDLSHPVVTTFQEYCDVVSKLANLRDLKTEIDAGVAEAETLLKSAALGGAIGQAWQGLGSAGKTIGSAAGKAADYLVGANPQAVAGAVQKGVQYGGAGLGLLAANAALQEVTDRPGVQKATGALKSLVPGTQEYQVRRYNNQLGQ
jgi:hypothetical protein